MLVPAPPLFSMTTCWPQIFASCSATMRATMSVGPPAANGTMKRTTRLGQSSDCICASAARPLRLAVSADPADRASRRRRVSTKTPGCIYSILAENTCAQPPMLARQRSSFEPNSLEAIDGVRQNLQESFRLTRHPRFPHDLVRIIHDADARLLDRHIESSKIVHVALLLLMLEAA